MSDHADLRRLANAAVDEEKALRADEDARVEAYAEGTCDDIHSDMDDWESFDDIPPAHLEWYGAASPAAILQLLDERDRLRDAWEHIAAGNLSPCILFAERILAGDSVADAHHYDVRKGKP